MLNLFRRWYERHFSQPGTIEFAVVLICAFLIVYYLMWLVGPIVVALCIAYCLEWPVQGLQRLTQCGRQMAASVVMLIFCSIVILITVLLIPQIVKQGAEFYNSIISFSLEASTPQNKASDANTTSGTGTSIDIERTPQGLQVTVPAPSSAVQPNPASEQPVDPNTAPQSSTQDPQSQQLLTKKVEHNAAAHGTAASVHTEILASGDSTAGINAGATATAPSSPVPSHAIVTTDATVATINGTANALENQQATNNAVIEASRTHNYEHSVPAPVSEDGLAEVDVTPALAINPEMVSGDLEAQAAAKIGGATTAAAAPSAGAASTAGTAGANNSKANQKQTTEDNMHGLQLLAQDVQQTDNAELAVKSQQPDESITVQAISDKAVVAHNESASIAEEGNKTTGMQIDLSFDNENTFKLTVSDFDTRLAQEAYLITLNLPEPIPSMLSIDDIKKAVRQVRIQTTAYLAELMRTKLMPSVVNLFTWAVYIIIVPIFTFLMLYNKEQLTKRAVLFILPNNQVLMRKFWPSLHQQISGYIRGKLLHIIIISIANSIAFKILNVNYALLLGIGVGLSVVIPYVGAVIIAVPVVLVAIFQFGFSESLLWVLAIYTVIQLLDSNVLTPMLFSKAMNLDAFSILAAILIFGGLWGFWGVFFAIPLATFIKTIVMQWPNKDVREQQKREHMRLIHVQKAEKLKQNRV